MPGRTLIALAAVLLALGLVACERLPQAKMPTASLKLETLPSVDAIPAEYGDLVSVTSDAQLPHSVQLWFQKPDKSIVVVFVDYRNHFILPQALAIPRR